MASISPALCRAPSRCPGAAPQTSPGLTQREHLGQAAQVLHQEGVGPALPVAQPVILAQVVPGGEAPLVLPSARERGRSLHGAAVPRCARCSSRSDFGPGRPPAAAVWSGAVLQPSCTFSLLNPRQPRAHSPPHKLTAIAGIALPVPGFPVIGSNNQASASWATSSHSCCSVSASGTRTAQQLVGVFAFSNSVVRSSEHIGCPGGACPRGSRTRCPLPRLPRSSTDLVACSFFSGFLWKAAVSPPRSENQEPSASAPGFCPRSGPCLHRVRCGPCCSGVPGSPGRVPGPRWPRSPRRPRHAAAAEPRGSARPQHLLLLRSPSWSRNDQRALGSLQTPNLYSWHLLYCRCVVRSGGR